MLSTKIDVAVAIGIFRPAILLPLSLTEPNSALCPLPSALRTILAHELAHVTNHDLHWLAANRTLLILLWPQPLFWLLRRRMRLDQEALADAAAAEITSRQTYAEQLVAWARALPPRPAPRFSAALGLWEGPSQLRQRIALLVDEHFTVLRNCSRRWRFAATCLAIGCALGLSTVTIRRPPHANAQDAAPVAANALSPLATGPTADANAREIPRPVPNTILGRVVDENGKPIAGAEAILFRRNRHDFARELVAQKASDADGGFRFEDVIDIAKEFPNGKFPPLDDLGDEFLQLVIRAPGRVSASRLMLPQHVAKRGEVQLLTMQPAATLRGRVTGPDSKPVARALVSVGLSPMDRWEGALSARTDADGNYVINDAAPFDMQKYGQQQEAQRRQREQESHDAFTADYVLFTMPPMLTVEHPDFAIKKTDYDKIPGTKDLQLEPAAILHGRVIYADSGSPAAGGFVQAAKSNPRRVLPSMDRIYSQHRAAVRTDADGKYRFVTLPAGTYDVWAETAGWLNAGIHEIAASTDRATTVPDLTLNKGGLIHVRLVDAKTREPIDLPPDAQAMLVVSPLSLPTSRPVFQRSIAANAVGKFEIRTLPGRNHIFVERVTSAGEPKWAGATSTGERSTEVDVIDGQTIDVDVPVADVANAQAQ